MPRFFRRLAEGVFDSEDLQRRTHELADFVRDACEAYALDAHRILAVGYSNGANIAASLLILRPETLTAAVLFRPMVPLVPDPLPNLAAKRVLVAAGRRDPIANSRETHRLAELLLATRASVEVHWEENGHELGEGDMIAARTWISRFVRSEWFGAM